jgi:hypothetical protein
MTYEHFFWLHVKKSAGITVRDHLQPYYLRLDRTKKPRCFIQSAPEEYNDILNNYRVVLGEYQFKRSLFAKKYLYPDNWDKQFSFAFSREPTERCISMFHYLYWQDGGVGRTFKNIVKQYVNTKKLYFSTAYAFDVFLDCVKLARTSDSIYSPIDLHFTTHTATMWDDITDSEGNVLLKKVYRVNDLVAGINQALEACGIDKKVENNKPRFNSNNSKKLYVPTAEQIKKIESIYRHDYDIFENAV